MYQVFQQTGVSVPQELIMQFPELEAREWSLMSSSSSIPTSNQSPNPVNFPSTASPEPESSSPYWFPRAAITNYHPGGLKTTETYSLTALMVRGLRSRFRQGWFLLEALSEAEAIPCLSPGFWWLLAILVAASLQSLPIWSHGIFPVCLCVQISLFL